MRRKLTSGVREPDGPAACVEITDTLDRLGHLVTQDEYAAGLADGRGRYPAVCGVTVLPTSLSTAPGQPCPACLALRRPILR